MTKSDKSIHDNMNDEEVSNYITSVLDAHGFRLYEFDVTHTENAAITKTHFITNTGWEITKKDSWDE